MFVGLFGGYGLLDYWLVVGFVGGGIVWCVL